ncbi:MAG TPA: pyridoxal-phosphate dependent enzyme [Streptosporangiaceae bacterium]
MTPRTWLGSETLAQLPAGTVPDAVVAGVGTGGTIAGVGQCFRARNASCQIVAVEPSESCTLLCGEVGRHLIDHVVAIDSRAAIGEMRRLAREHGLFAGPSSGANLLAARRLRASQPALRQVVTFFCDEGEKYINDHFTYEDDYPR